MRSRHYLECSGRKDVGSYAEFIRVPAKDVFPMPQSLNFAQTAAVSIASLTAFQSLFHSEKDGMVPGQRVLIHGAGRWRWQLIIAAHFAKTGGLPVAVTAVPLM
jgi:NADPH:quinone reductase-like Zn-dependent oxidoreductase